MLIRTIQTDTLFSSVYDSRSSMGYAAAEAAASAIRAVLERKETANVIFAAAPSQNEMLESLLRQDLDFSRINAFHMDEYLGLGLDDSASFSCYLTKHLFGRVTFRTVNLIPAKRTPEAACRAKPWGTGHALACCKGVVNGPFAVINADDFYGRTAFSEIYDFLAAQTDESKYAMVGYRLKNTVTEFGSVARGVCEIEDGMLTGVTERTKIFKKGADAEYTEDGEHFFPLAGDTIVSMNLWGFSARVLDELWARMGAFLTEAMKTNPLKCEYFLPFVVNEQLADKSASVQVLPCEETWYGVTYREDLAFVKEAVARMKAEGIYTEELWK